jgi:hypothetical protein
VHRHAAVVEIDPVVVDLVGRLQVDHPRQRPDDGVVGQVLPVAELAAHDVVLLARNPGLPPVGRQRDREEEVRNPARFLIAVNRVGVELEDDPAGHLHGRGVDLDDLSAAVGRDEPRDVHALAVVRHGDPPRLRTDVDVADDLAVFRI